MRKSARKSTKRAISSARRKVKKTVADRAKAAEYVSCLIELHKLQGALLTHLSKQV